MENLRLMKKHVGALLALGISWSSAHGDWTLYDPEEWFDLNAHLRITGAQSSGALEELATHGHDPNEEFTVQGFEIEPRVFLNDHVRGVAGFNILRTIEDEFEAEFEEGYAQFADLPGGFEVRAGRFFNRFGLQNRQHLHAWNFVDSNLVTTNFLSDENLATDGLELNWTLPLGSLTSVATVSYGDVVLEEEGEEEEEEVGSEEGNLASDAWAARWLVRWDVNDFHRHEWGINVAMGDNGFGEGTDIYAVDYLYQWRENGLEPGGRFFEAGTEIFFREVDFVDEDLGMNGHADHWGLSAHARYGFGRYARGDWDAGVRFDYLEGVSAGAGGDDVFAVGERMRYSAALTYRYELSDQFGGLIRLQGNIDDLEEGTEQSVFLQLGFDYGGNDGV